MYQSRLPRGKRRRQSTWGTERSVRGRLCLVKEGIDPAKHTLRCMDAYAVDAQKLDQLRFKHGEGVIVRQVDGRVLYASVGTFDEYGVPWETGVNGSQIALPLVYWREVPDPHFGEAA